MRTIIVGAVVGVVSAAGCAQVERPRPGGAIGNTGPAPGAVGVPMDPQRCGGQTFRLENTPPNVMLVLDRSASMSSAIGNTATTSKWDDLNSAIGALIDRYDANVRLGATFFAADDNCAAGLVGAIAAQNGGAIRDQLAKQSPGGNTPTATTLDAIMSSRALADASRANYLVLATDGMPNCDDVDVTRRIQQLFDSTPSVRTFVIGIGSETDSSPDLLNQWADAGRTAREGATHYFQTSSSAALDAAFDAVARSIVSCDFRLSAAPDDPQSMNVTENGLTVAPSPTSGWTYDKTTHTVTLHGAACDQVRNDMQTDVAVVYGCPQLIP